MKNDFVCLIDPQGVILIPEIPDYYSEADREECLILGAWNNDTLRELRGCIVITKSPPDGLSAVVRYIYVKDGEDPNRVLSELIKEAVHQLGLMGIKGLSLYDPAIEDEHIGYITDTLLKDFDALEQDYDTYGCGWHLSDICELELVSKGTFMGELDEEIKIIRKSDSFCLEGKDIAGTMTVELFDADTVVVTSAYSENEGREQEIFERLLAGALDTALEGIGTDAVLLGRFDSEKERRKMESALGESDFKVEFKTYFIPIGG